MDNIGLKTCHNQSRRIIKFITPRVMNLNFIRAYFFFVVFAGGFCRLPLFSLNVAQNPDEAEMLATAKLATKSFAPYSNYTTTSMGPVWPEFLAIFKSLGFNFDFKFAHILAFILILIAFLPIEYLLLRRYPSNFLVFLSTLVVNVGVIIPLHRDFNFLATTTLPLALLTLVVILIKAKPNNTRTFLAGFLSGLAVLSKYQVAPLVLSVLLMLTFHEQINFKRLTKYLYGFFGSLTFVFIWILSGDGLNRFIFGSLKFSFLYFGVKDIGYGDGSGILHKLAVGISLIINNPSVIMLTLFALISILQPYLTRSIRPMDRVRNNYRNSLVSLSFIIFGFFAITIPGHQFSFYLLIFFWSLLMSIMVANSLLAESTDVKNDARRGELDNGFLKRVRPLRLLFTAIICPLAIYGIQDMRGVQQDQLFSNLSYIQKGVDEQNESIKTRLATLNSEGVQGCPKNSRVLIWGWASEYYTYFNWEPASTFVNDAMQYVHGFQKPEIAEQVIRNLQNHDLDCVFDAVGPNYWGNFAANESVSIAIPGASAILKADYIKSKLKISGGTMWVRNR